ncbi:MAG: excinuclease ABC subunit UvrC [Capsulimonadaceae bacterium]
MPGLEEKLASLPTEPGCYLFKDDAGVILYVGKAVNLRNRVRSYFQKGTGHSLKTRKLISRTVDMDVIVVDSELEALILECNLIKQHRPQYNVRLRDDKQYPYLVLTLTEPFPRLLVTRKVKTDGNRYWGPFTNSGAVWESLRLIYRLFPLVTCRKRWDNTPVQRPCLYYHMSLCPQAPCAGMADAAEYGATVDDVALFLDGKQEKLTRQLRAQMEEASDNLLFEKAARLRDQIAAVETLIERQKVVADNGADQDVIALVNDAGDSAVQVFFIRNGKLVGQDHFVLDGVDSETSIGEATAEFLKQYYQDAAYVPREIILPAHVDDAAIIEQWLRSKKGRKVILTVPERGEKKHLLAMASANAKLAIEQLRANAAYEYDRTMGALMELQEALEVDTPLERIEAYDISTMQGSHSVGGMVVFEQGKPAKSQYRRFRIRMPVQTGEPNDFAMMREVLTRRLKEAKDGNKKFARLPDLMVIDGGKGQLGVAIDVAREMDVELNMIGLAKQYELIFRPGHSAPLALPTNSRGLQLLQRVRDEVHRFSVTYHRTLRAKSATRSVLDDVPGIGPARRKELLKFFGSVDKMRSATVDDIAAAPGMSKRLAGAVHRMLHGEEAGHS